MADSEVQVIISGQAAGAIGAMQEAAAAVQAGVAQMQESIGSLTSAFTGFGEIFAGFAGVLGGGEAFKSIIEATKQWSEAAIQLGIALGTSASQASVYNVGIESVGGSTDDIITAMRGLTRQVKTNEDGMNAMGIATRDSAGNLRASTDIFWDAIAAVNSYKEGLNRNEAALMAFGRGASSTGAIFRMSRADLQEYLQTAEDLGLIVGANNVQAFEENRAAMAQMNLAFLAFKKAIADSILPALTEFLQGLRAISPVVIGLYSGPIADLTAAFWGLLTVVRAFGAIAAGIFSSISDTVEQLFEAVGHAMQRNFTQAAADLKNIGTKVGDDWGNVWKTVTADAAEAKQKIVALFADQKVVPDAPQGGKDYKAPQNDSGSDQRLALYKNALDQMSQAKGDFDKKDIAADLEYWRQILANTTGGTAADAKLRAEISKEILTLERKQHDEEIKEQQDAIKTKETLDLGALSAKQTQLQQELAMGQITQAQELAGEISIQNQIYAVKKKALDDDIALAQFDQLQKKKLLDEELILEQQHAAAVKKIQDQAALEQRKEWDSLFKSMESGFSSTIKNFLNGTKSLGATIKGLFSDIANSIISAIANMAAKWLATSLEQLLESKTSAVGIIGALAAQAAAGAFAATAAIPYVGPELAPAAAAEAYSSTMAFGALASAAGGYDIPSNINPLAQLHKSEMVLPASIANPLRQSIKSGGGLSGSNVNLSVTAFDSRSLVKNLQRNGALAKAIRSLGNRFVTP